MSIDEFLKSNNYEEFEEKIRKEIMDKTEKITELNNKTDKKIETTNDDDEKKRLKKMKKQTPIEAIRIATMGRMTELGIVHWHINEIGRSEYTIEDKKLAESITN
jgi:hypothetical protein